MIEYMKMLEGAKSPQALIGLIKKNKDLHEWIISNTPPECKTMIERVYLIKNPEISPWCIRGNFRKFKNGKYQSYCSGHCPCSKEEKKRRFLENYGVENPQQLESVRKKTEETNLRRYGVENPQQLESVRKKTEETNFAKYGVKSVLQIDENRHKARLVNLQKYGKEYFLQSEKFSNTLYSKYGVENPGQLPDHAEKIRSTSKKIYGDDHIMKTEYGLEKHKKSIIEKYGVENPKQIGKDIDSINDFNNDETFTRIYNQLNSTHEVAKFFRYTLTPVQKRAKELGLPIKFSPRSAGETELANEISKLSSNVKVNDRTSISPYEIDILVDNRVGIEYNGAYWHSDIFIGDKNYHLEKTIRANQNGILLIHVFDVEWNKDPDLILSIIKSKLGITDNRIHARQCEIVLLSSSEHKKFFEQNHIQGPINAQVAFGLIYNGNLVSAMSFGRSRFDKNAKWELLRFASLRHHQVVGAASKLLTHFRKEHKGSIVSYANRRFSNDGNLYKILGFEFVGETKPNLWFYNPRTNKLESRIKYQKHKLHNLLDNYDPSKTAIENMIAHSYYPVYDCGNLKWRLK